MPNPYAKGGSKYVAPRDDFADASSGGSSPHAKRSANPYARGGSKYAPPPEPEQRRGAKGSYDQLVGLGKGLVSDPLGTIGNIAKVVRDDYRAAANPIIGDIKSNDTVDRFGQPIYTPMAKVEKVTRENTPHANETVGDWLKGVRNTAVNVGSAVAPWQGFAARTALNAVGGAITDDEDRVRGAITNAVAGEVFTQVIKAPARVGRAAARATDFSGGMMEGGVKGLGDDLAQEGNLWKPGRDIVAEVDPAMLKAQLAKFKNDAPLVTQITRQGRIPAANVPPNMRPRVEPPPEATTYSAKGPNVRRPAPVQEPIPEPRLTPARFESELTGSSHGQTDGHIIALDASGKGMGVVQWSKAGDELSVRHVNVRSEYRRQGIATRLYEQLLAENPGTTLARAGTYTPEGLAFRDAFDNGRPVPEPVPEIVPESIPIPEPNPAPEQLTRATIKLADGRVFSSPPKGAHFNAVDDALSKGVKDFELETAEEGFATNLREHIPRGEATRLVGMNPEAGNVDASIFETDYGTVVPDEPQPRPDPQTVSYPPEPDIQPVAVADAGGVEVRPGAARDIGPTSSTPLRRIRPDDMEDVTPSLSVEEANRRVEAARAEAKAEAISKQERLTKVRGRWAPGESLRSEDGALVRDLTNIPDEALEAELQRIYEQNATEDAQAAAIREAGYRNDYEELPRTERLGRRGQEDLPDADGTIDPEQLLADNKTIAEYNKNQIVRQARARAATRLEAELAARKPERYRRVEEGEEVSRRVEDEAPEDIDDSFDFGSNVDDAPDDSFDFGSNVDEAPVTRVPASEPSAGAATPEPFQRGPTRPEHDSPHPRDNSREYINYARANFDKTFDARIRDHVERGRADGSIDKGYQGFEEQSAEAFAFKEKVAKDLIEDPRVLSRERLKGLTGAQVQGMKLLVQENAAMMEASSRVINDSNATLAEITEAQSLYDKAAQTTDDALGTIVTETAQIARSLGGLRNTAKHSLDADVWLVQAKKMLGDKPMNDATMTQIRRLAREAAEACG